MPTSAKSETVSPPKGVPRLREALELDAIPVTIEFRFTRRTASRVG